MGSEPRSLVHTRLAGWTSFFPLLLTAGPCCMQTRGISRRRGPTVKPSSASRASRSKSRTPTTANASASEPGRDIRQQFLGAQTPAKNTHSQGDLDADNTCCVSSALMATAPDSIEDSPEDGADKISVSDNSALLNEDGAVVEDEPAAISGHVEAVPLVEEENEPLSQDSILHKETASQDSVWRDVLTGNEPSGGDEQCSQGSESYVAASQESVSEMLLRSYEEPLGASQQ